MSTAKIRDALAARGSRVPRLCRECGGVFQPRKKDEGWPSGQFCSLRCWNLDRALVIWEVTPTVAWLNAGAYECRFCGDRFGDTVIQVMNQWAITSASSMAHYCCTECKDADAAKAAVTTGHIWPPELSAAERYGLESSSTVHHHQQGEPCTASKI